MNEKDIEATGTSPVKGAVGNFILCSSFRADANLAGTAHSHGQTSNYDDPSSTIWSVYVSEADVYDKTLVEGWTADMDGILIFVRNYVFFAIKPSTYFLSVWSFLCQCHSFHS